MDVDETDYESLALLKFVRKLIDEWIALGDIKKRDKYLKIPPPSRQKETQTLDSVPSILNRFQKRLVHQVVEVEYPDFVTIGRPGFVQIIDYDEKREVAVRDKRVQWCQKRVRKQTGFRWIAEALAWGDLTHLSTNYFPGVRGNTASTEQGKSLQEFVENFKARLKAHRPILVGHNLFTDLVYFFRCFFWNPTEPCRGLSVHGAQAFSYCHRYKTDLFRHTSSFRQIFVKLSAQLGSGSQIRPAGSPSNTSLTAAHGLNNRFSHLHVEETSNGLASPLVVAESERSDGVLGQQSHAEEIRLAEKGLLISRPNFQFWRVYGNNLRNFGTKEKNLQNMKRAIGMCAASI
ncbi:CAF1 family ribonuclease [Aspergillus nidulans FGSC A4]|uniref:CAF1 family ribonuclease, putative (AFU_orthologue AFUA_2G16960) n=1 Tax=Emericella nidulans (strain FGSC A4 / ATCC 38163 / CBS 112.46 / NRRL 194 / M139) TaxID=227321 RepID=C8VCS2_EMENI|nr:hypothetical protein [Aspergillus nidulans FGSC A4]CBF78697.1 TPA: CAF1 family ribonuclease, putative (AFU_orthologue; AFUA_2G16960) [Aspergillus nidulans FGSC A4]